MPRRSNRSNCNPTSNFDDLYAVNKESTVEAVYPQGKSIVSALRGKKELFDTLKNKGVIELLVRQVGVAIFVNNPVVEWTPFIVTPYIQWTPLIVTQYVHYSGLRK